MNDLIKSKFRCGIGTAEQNKNQLLCISIPTKFLVAATNSFWLTEVLQKREGTQESAEERCISGFPCDVGTLLFAEKKIGQAGSCTMRRLSYRKVQIKIAGSGTWSGISRPFLLQTFVVAVGCWARADQTFASNSKLEKFKKFKRIYKLFKRRTCFSCCINITWTIFS